MHCSFPAVKVVVPEIYDPPRDGDPFLAPENPRGPGKGDCPSSQSVRDDPPQQCDMITDRDVCNQQTIDGSDEYRCGWYPCVSTFQKRFPEKSPRCRSADDPCCGPAYPGCCYVLKDYDGKGPPCKIPGWNASGKTNTCSAGCPVCTCENPESWLTSGCDVSCGAKCGDTCCCIAGVGDCGKEPPKGNDAPATPNGNCQCCPLSNYMTY
jgi:hypothetical protein